MYDRLSEVKKQHENKKKEDFFGVTLHPRDIDWLIEQAEELKRLKDKQIFDVDLLLDSSVDFRYKGKTLSMKERKKIHSFIELVID